MSIQLSRKGFLQLVKIIKIFGKKLLDFRIRILVNIIIVHIIRAGDLIVCIWMRFEYESPCICFLRNCLRTV